MSYFRNFPFNFRRPALGIAIGIISLFGFKSLYDYIRHRYSYNKLEKKINKAREDRDFKINKFLKDCELKVDKETQLKIVSMDAIELGKAIKKKEVSCEQVFISFGIRICTIGKEYNLIADHDLEGGLQAAIEADKALTQGKYYGPLHGIPFSVSEQISLVGTKSTCGYSEYVSKEENKFDSMIVSILRSQGAIPCVKSNVPQGLVALEANNNLWGRAKNPWNPQKITNGDSGLVASRCIPFGVGYDFIGQLRISSNFCGVFGFKPSSNRISKHGGLTYNGTPYVGFQAINESWGLVCRSIPDLVLVSCSLFGHFEDDLFINNQPFDSENFDRPIDLMNNKPTIAYIGVIPECPVAPSVLETLRIVVAQLKETGYNIIEFVFPDLEEFIQTGILLLLNAGILESVQKELKEEPMVPFYQEISSILNRNETMKQLYMMRLKLFGNKRLTRVMKKYKQLNRSEYIETTRRFVELKNKFLNFFKTSGYSALITPVFPTPALDSNLSYNFLLFNYFAYLFSFADMPAVSLPIKLNANVSYKAKIGDRLDGLLTSISNTSLGLPVGIQIGGLSHNETLILKIARDVNLNHPFEGNVIFNILAAPPKK